MASEVRSFQPCLLLMKDRSKFQNLPTRNACCFQRMKPVNKASTEILRFNITFHQIIAFKKRCLKYMNRCVTWLSAWYANISYCLHWKFTSDSQ